MIGLRDMAGLGSKECNSGCYGYQWPHNQFSLGPTSLFLASLSIEEPMGVDVGGR